MHIHPLKLKNVRHHHDGVWIGWLPEYGHVVFDPDIKNLYVFRDDDEDASDPLISLWIEKTRSYKPIEIDYARTAYFPNPKHLDNYQIRRISRKYWHWRCGMYSKAKFLELQEEQKISQLSDEWLEREQERSSSSEEDISPEEDYHRNLINRCQDYVGIDDE